MSVWGQQWVWDKGWNVGRLQETGMNMSNLFAKQLITTTEKEEKKVVK